jgi:hypothetical protein
VDVGIGAEGCRSPVTQERLHVWKALSNGVPDLTHSLHVRKAPDIVKGFGRHLAG